MRKFHRHPSLAALSPLYRLRQRLVWGGTLIAFGLTWLLHEQGLLQAREIWLALPATLVWAGLVRVTLERSAGAAWRLAGRLLIAALLVGMIEHIGPLALASTWPVLLIVAGIAVLARTWLGRGCGACGPAQGQP